MYFAQAKAKSYAFILHNLYFLFCFLSKIRVPSWTCVIKAFLLLKALDMYFHLSIIEFF